MILVFVFGEPMIDSQCAKQEAQALQKKNRRSKNMRWIQHDRTAWNWECFVFCDFVGKVAEIQKTLDYLKNQTQGAHSLTNGVYRSALLLFPWQT